MRKFCYLLTVVACGCLWSTLAAAQTKVSWSDSCSKPDATHVLPVGDRAGHSLGLEQFKCHATTPADIGGSKVKEGTATDTFDASGDESRFRGVYVLSTESGDKVFLPYQGTGASKDGKPTDSHGTWIMVGGTGKLKGIKGKGSFKCAADGDNFKCDAEGEYELAK